MLHGHSPACLRQALAHSCHLRNGTSLSGTGGYASAQMGRVRVAITERAVAFQRGLEPACTRAGFTVDHPADVIAWSQSGGDRVAVITLMDAAACDLVEAASGAGASVVALLPEPSAQQFAHAIGHGAVAAIDWAADPEDIAAVIAAAANRLSLLPTEVVRALTPRRYGGHGPPIDSMEADWLRALSRGQTVVELADEAGYSERSMFRRLHDLYEKLGVPNRDAAVREAERLGLLETGDEPHHRPVSLL